MNKIAMICPYFGELPKYFKVTLNSMKNNSFIDWYIFTDVNIQLANDYNNIIVKNMNIDELKLLIHKKIGTNLKNAYKLCDYKVTYGLLFQDYIKQYEFWGYYDLDVIYGDLYDFLLNKLEKYDKILDLGHFSILKNNEKMIKLFTKAPLYKKILNSENIYVFDEAYNLYDIDSRGINGLVLDEKLKLYSNRLDYMDLDIKYNNFFPEHMDKKKHYYFIYQNNKLFMKITRDYSFTNEIIYVHLQKKKNIPVYINDYNNFIIMPKGFINDKMKSDKYYYKKNLKIWWYIKFRFFRKFKKFFNNEMIRNKEKL